MCSIHFYYHLKLNKRKDRELTYGIFEYSNIVQRTILLNGRGSSLQPYWTCNLAKFHRYKIPHTFTRTLRYFYIVCLTLNGKKVEDIVYLLQRK